MSVTVQTAWPKDPPSKRLPSNLAKQRLELEGTMELAPKPNGGLANLGRIIGLLPQNLAVALLRLVGLCPRGEAAYRQMSLQENHATLPLLPEDLSGLRMLQISDLHTDLNPAVIDAVLRVLPKAGADFTILTGDFRCRATCKTDLALTHLDRLIPQLPKPVIAILGNHDTLAIADWLETRQVRVLMNETICLENATGATLQIAGIDDAHYFQTHDLTEALCERQQDKPLILLSHTPATWAEAQKADVCYMLSGHTHGGQICLPGGRPIRIHKGVPKQAVAGPWQFGTLSGYTCRGAGGSGIPTRINCPPQITLHTLLSPRNK